MMENSELITKALSYIGNEYKKNEISIDDIAMHAGFSTDYFNRIFFAHTGFTVMEYVRFTRLKTAALLLRISEKDILSIALDCGYDSHESFSRAFKKQYGLTPSDYRRKHENVEAYYGDFFNDTIGSRLIHEFKGLKIADSDEVIDFMLEYDALRYGYAAVCFRVNGGIALYNGEDYRTGFVWFTEWEGRYEGEIICDDWGKIAEYLKMFSDNRFDMIVYTLKTDGEIKEELTKYGLNKSVALSRACNIYTDAPYDLTAPEGITMRLLTHSDLDLITSYYEIRSPGEGKNHPQFVYLERQLFQRDVLGNSEHSVFLFGIFKEETLIGLSSGGLQRTHGFVINNCVVTSVLPEYEKEKLYQYAFKFVTNAALEKGALPIDDIQTPNTPEEDRSGQFNSADLGYRTITNAFVIK